MMRLNFAMLSNPMQNNGGTNGTRGTTNTDAIHSRPTRSGKAGDKVGQAPSPMAGIQAIQPNMSRLSLSKKHEVGHRNPSIDAAVPLVPLVPRQETVNERDQKTIEARMAGGNPAREQQEGEVTSHQHETHAAIVEWYPDTVTVEPSKPVTQQPSAPLSVEEESEIQSWLTQIGETDPATIAELLDKCQQDMAARGDFIAQARAQSKPAETVPDDRRTCNQCENLIDGSCYGDMVALLGYVPNAHQPRRCEGYAPREDDSDRRLGWERWPGLIQKQRD